MQCPECGGASLVYGGYRHGAARERYRKCKECGHKFKTWEEGGAPVRGQEKAQAEEDAPLLAVMEQGE